MLSLHPKTRAIDIKEIKRKLKKNTQDFKIILGKGDEEFNTKIILSSYLLLQKQSTVGFLIMLLKKPVISYNLLKTNYEDDMYKICIGMRRFIAGLELGMKEFEINQIIVLKTKFIEKLSNFLTKSDENTLSQWSQKADVQILGEVKRFKRKNALVRRARNSAPPLSQVSLVGRFVSCVITTIQCSTHGHTCKVGMSRFGRWRQVSAQRRRSLKTGFLNSRHGFDREINSTNRCSPTSCAITSSTPVSRVRCLEERTATDLPP